MIENMVLVEDKFAKNFILKLNKKCQLILFKLNFILTHQLNNWMSLFYKY